MPKERLGLIDNIYLRVCNFALDYGGLALAAAGGAAIADSNSAVLGETARGYLVTGGFVGGVGVAPGLDILVSGTMLHSDIPQPGDNTLYDQYVGSQVGRNLFAYFGGWQFAEGIRSGSIPVMVASSLFGGLAIAGHVFGRRAKRELEARIRKRTLLSTQPAF